jgi:hypothetical protein
MLVVATFDLDRFNPMGVGLLPNCKLDYRMSAVVVAYPIRPDAAPAVWQMAVEGTNSPSWTDDAYSVVLLDADFPDGMTLRSVLQALGVEVHSGPHCVDAQTSPLILLHTCNRQCPEVSIRLEVARRLLPESAIGFVTGDFLPEFDAIAFDDARRLLGSVGIGFVSVPNRS